MPRILIVEDEESYRDAMEYMLTREGFDVHAVADGESGLASYDRDGADLVLLDLMLPGLSGIEVCTALRERGPVSVIIVSARDAEVDKVIGLELGADDYVTKPFSHRELLARIRAVLRRAGNSGPEPDELEVGAIQLDVVRHEVRVAGETLQLPFKEFSLLELFMRHCGKVMSRQALITQVWGSDYVGDTKTLDVHVLRLRAKIEADPGHPQILLTVRGVGYKLVDPAEVA